jgi:hypothetical protein
MRREMFEEGMLGADYVEWPSVLFYQEAHTIYVENELRAGAKPGALLSLFKTIAIWRQLCFVIKQQLLHGRGTRVEGIGTFTLDVKEAPCFFADPIFMKVYKISAHKKPIKGATLNQGIQYTSVLKGMRDRACTRDDVEKVVEVMAEAVRWAIDHGVKSLSLQVTHFSRVRAKPFFLSPLSLLHAHYLFLVTRLSVYRLTSSPNPSLPSSFLGGRHGRRCVWPRRRRPPRSRHALHRRV